MAFDTTNLRNINGDPSGDASYVYDAGSDTMATVAAAGYFNNSDDNQNLAADDRIWCQCSDGNMTLRVSAVSSGSVTTQFAGGNLPIISQPGTGTAAALASAFSGVGQVEIASEFGTATRYTLPTPYPGAEMKLLRVGSGSQGFSFDAGGSGATSIYIGSATATQQRRVVLQTELDMIHLVGISTTRWRVQGLNVNASAVAPAGGSVFFPGT